MQKNKLIDITGSAQQSLELKFTKRMYKQGQLIIIVTHIVSLQHIFQHYHLPSTIYCTLLDGRQEFENEINGGAFICLLSCVVANL
jgi:hypothetical protein